LQFDPNAWLRSDDSCAYDGFDRCPIAPPGLERHLLKGLAGVVEPGRRCEALIRIDSQRPSVFVDEQIK
jgi:hypothetical protein